MKNKLNLIALAISLVLVSIGSVFAQTQNTNPTVEDPDLKIINDKTLVVKDMIFPKMATGFNKTASSVCQMGQMRDVLAIDFDHQEQPVFPKGKVTYEGTTPYSPPLGTWIISSYKLTDGSASGYSRNLTAVPGGYTFVTSSQYEKTYESLKEFVAKLNILDKYKADIDSKLKIFTKNYSSYSQSLNVSAGSVLLYVKLESKGKFNGRSWYKGQVTTTEVCSPPEIFDAAAFKQTLTDWINETVNALPNKGKGRIIPFSNGNMNVQRAPTNNGAMTTILSNPQPSPTPR